MRLRPWRRLLRLALIFLVSAALATSLVLVRWRPPTTEHDHWEARRSHQTEYIDKRGIHVVVGHYMGDDLPWINSPNLTQDILDANMYEPQPGAGELGQPVLVPTYEMKKMQKLFQINRFNLVASDRISVNRSLPDVRKKKCHKKKMPSSLPDTSIIIVFHNEAWSTLLRTVHSVINRSPPSLLREILLVDDASDRKFLKAPLDQYVANLSVETKVLRSVKRVGLIKARLMGAEKARGQVLTFLDAHCECTPGWLEPLLQRVSEDRTRIACPVIDIIHDDSFSYVRSFELHWGAFNWELHFRWFTIGSKDMEKRRTDSTEPFRTPVMAGGLFSIDKNYFYEMGAYDEQMDIWGGENLELSFRNWMCGGSVEIVPCSHVGHLFRRSSPYTFPREGGMGGVLYANLARVAQVWMDQWADFYFRLNPEANRIRDQQSVRSRIKLRERLKCHSFEWYLDNVWPEHFLPKEDRFFGKIRNQKSSTCLQRPRNKGGVNQPSGTPSLGDCVIEAYMPQLFVKHPDGYLMTDESMCLDALDVNAPHVEARLVPCNQLERQKWEYNAQQNTMQHKQSGLCLDLPEQGTEGLNLTPCKGVTSQMWTLEPVSWK